MSAVFDEKPAPLRSWHAALNLKVAASGTVRLNSKVVHASNDLRSARAWVWQFVRDRAIQSAPGAMIVIDDELTGIHRLVITNTHEASESVDQGVSAEDSIGPFGSTAEGDGQPDPVVSLIDRFKSAQLTAQPLVVADPSEQAPVGRDIMTTTQSAVRPGKSLQAVRQRARAFPAWTPKTWWQELTRRTKIILLSGLTLLTAGALATGISLTVAPLLNSTNNTQEPSTSSAPASWPVPDGFTLASATSSLVVGAQNGALTALDGATGQRIDLGVSVKVTDPAQVHAVVYGNNTLITTGDQQGVLIGPDQPTVPFTGKFVLTRGTVPALYSKPKDGYQYWILQGTTPVSVKPPLSGSALFGALPSGPVWAGGGGKIVYAPTSELPRTVTLVPAVKKATIVAWLKITDQRAAVVWKDGNHRVLTIHDTTAAGAGRIVARTELTQGTVTESVDGTVVTRAGAGAAITGILDIAATKSAMIAAQCSDPALAAAQLWCPQSATGAWVSNTGEHSPAKPLAATEDFVLFASGNGYETVRREKPTTSTQEKK